jgi:hypothetical protein
VFSLCGVEFPPSPDILAVTCSKSAVRARADEEGAARLIEGTLDKLMSEGFLRTCIEKLDRAGKIRFVKMLRVAALAELNRYPLTQPASPTGHRPSGTRR